MSYLQKIELGWDSWKELHTDTSAAVYYLQNDLQYVPFYIAPNSNTFPDAEALYYVNVNRDPSSVSGPYAALSSGVKAFLHLQDITYTANAYGTGGNSITISYVDTSAAATGTITVVDHLQLTGAILTVNGVVLTEGAEWTAITSNNATATSIASAITTATATTLSTGGAIGAVITVTANDATFKSNFISLATSNAVNLTISGNYLTGGEGGAGYEYVVVVGTAITVHITTGKSTAQQVMAAVTGWNAYSGISQYNSSASSALVSAVIDTGKEGSAQVNVGATPLATGAAAVTVLADWETNFKGSATLTTSFANGVADLLS